MGYEVTLNGEFRFSKEREATIVREVTHLLAPFAWVYREGDEFTPEVESVLPMCGFYIASRREWTDADGDRCDKALVVDFTDKWSERHEALLVGLAKAGVGVWLTGGGTGDIYDLWELRTHNGTPTPDGLAYSWELFRREGRVSWDGPLRRVEVEQEVTA
jgi:hypothetical protein